MHLTLMVLNMYGLSFSTQKPHFLVAISNTDKAWKEEKRMTYIIIPFCLQLLERNLCLRPNFDLWVIVE